MRRDTVVYALTGLVLIVLAIASYSAYSQPELDTSNWPGVVSPMLAGAVPPLAAIARQKRFSRPRIAGLGALTSAVFFVVPLYLGLRQQAPDQQLAFAAVFISWLATAAGLAGAFAAGIVLGIHGVLQSRAQAQHRARIVQTIEREIRAANGSATLIELGPLAFDALAHDWGNDASALVVSRPDGRYLGLASDRWPAATSVPKMELPIVRAGAGDHVHIRTEKE